MATTEQLAIVGGPRAIPEDAHKVWPEITQADRDAVNRVLDRNVFAGANAPEITALQKEYAEYVGVEYAVAMNSGTAALHAAAVALGVRPGDEVIVPAFTFVASAMAMAHQGAQVVFADVDPRTYNLDPTRLEERITERTRAIVAVHIHGQPADLDEITAIASRHGIPVIEDNAQAHGIDYKGKTTGSITEAAGTSTNVSKNLSGGEGGIFTTDDEEKYVAARRLAVFGEDLVALEARAFWSHGVGWNYRNQELACALTRAQLSRLDGFNQQAEANGKRLTAALAEIDGLTPPYQADDRGCSYWKYAVQLDPAALGFDGDVRDLRDRLVHALLAEGVEAMVWQPQPIPAQPVWRRAQKTWQPGDDESARPWDAAEFPVASRLCDVTINLGTELKPLYTQEPELMDRYVDGVRKVLGNLETVLEAPFENKRKRMI